MNVLRMEFLCKEKRLKERRQNLYKKRLSRQVKMREYSDFYGHLTSSRRKKTSSLNNSFHEKLGRSLPFKSDNENVSKTSEEKFVSNQALSTLMQETRIQDEALTGTSFSSFFAQINNEKKFQHNASIEEPTLTKIHSSNGNRIPRNCRVVNLSSSSGLRTPSSKIERSSKTSCSSKMRSSECGRYILAVTEGRGQARGEVGLAGMDPTRPLLVLCQISDGQRYVNSLSKMNVFDFEEVIVPNTFANGASGSKLYCDIRSRFPDVTVTSVQRRHFSEIIGMELIKQYCSLKSSSIMVLLQDKFYALSAAAALIKYLEFTQNVHLASRSLTVEYQGTEDTMLIDLDTANRLELTMCISHPETNFNNSLMGVVNHCHTKGGVRLLRANILQPFCSLVKIQNRLNCVTELINDPLLFCAIEAIITGFTNVEGLLNLCMHTPQQNGLRAAEYQLKYTLLLKTTLEVLPKLISTLEKAKSEYFRQLLRDLKDPRFTAILNRILETVLENAKSVKGSVAAHLHGCFAIKAGVNSLLDIAKKTYCEIIQEITDHVTKLRDIYSLPLRISFSADKGFHIQCSQTVADRFERKKSLPEEFILVHKSKSTFTFYTAELVALDQRSQNVLNEIKLMTNTILYELLTDIRQDINCLFTLCETVAELDVLISFAHVGSGRNYVKPNFGGELQLKESRHPILDVTQAVEIVPNDVLARDGQNFIILTGPNQSGKSIYIRQVALLQIMAQIGCYIPAREATLKITNRIFSRIGFDDSIENSACTLMVEMRDIEYIRQNMKSHSMVIIDELCRGTSVEEGTNLAFSVCEELLDMPAYVFLTTHYLLLSKLEEMYFTVKNYHFEMKTEVSECGKEITRFTHKLKEGVTSANSYGLHVARLTSFPEDIWQRAKSISARLDKTRKPDSKIRGLMAEYALSLKLKQEINRFKSLADVNETKSLIREYRKEYLNSAMSEVDVEQDCWEKRQSNETRVTTSMRGVEQHEIRPRKRENKAAASAKSAKKIMKEPGLILTKKIKAKYKRIWINSSKKKE